MYSKFNLMANCQAMEFRNCNRNGGFLFIVSLICFAIIYTYRSIKMYKNNIRHIPMYIVIKIVPNIMNDLLLVDERLLLDLRHIINTIFRIHICLYIQNHLFFICFLLYKRHELIIDVR